MPGTTLRMSAVSSTHLPAFALTLFHIAVHDALNAIDPEDAFYSFDSTVRKTDPNAASSQGAFEVLMKMYLQRKDTLEKGLNKWLNTIATEMLKHRSWIG